MRTKTKAGSGTEIKAKKKAAINGNRPFLNYLISRMLNRFGDSIDVFLLSWLVYGLSGSASLSALAVGLNYLPTILLQPLAGAFVEQLPKRRVIALTDAGRALLVAGFFGLYLTGRLNAAALMAGTFLISTLEAFASPASSAALSGLLKAEEYDSGMSLYQAGSRIMELAGTGAAGLLIAAAGNGGALAVDLFCFAAACLLVSRVPETGGTEGGISDWLHDLREGFQFIRTSKPLLFVVSAAAFLNAALTPGNALQAALFQDVYRKGSGALSAMGICTTVGMLLGAGLHSAAANSRGEAGKGKGDIDRILPGCAILMGSYYLVLAWLGTAHPADVVFYPALFSVSLLFGVSVGLANTAVSVLLLRVVPTSFMARASAVMNAGCTAAVPFTSFLVSAICARASVVSVLAGTAVPVLAAAVILRGRGRRKGFPALEKKTDGEPRSVENGGAASGKEEGERDED